MTTKLAGAKITGILALTLEAQSALKIGQPVHMTGDYMCDLADGTKSVVGFVSVANVRRGFYNANPATNQAGLYPVAAVPGDVTVEARGVMVLAMTASAAIAVGNRVGITAAGAVVDAGLPAAAIPANTVLVGIALEPGTTGNLFDVLVTASA